MADWYKDSRDGQVHGVKRVKKREVIDDVC
jgi:hypothetical protein